MGRKHTMGNHNQIPARPDGKMGRPAWGSGHTVARRVYQKVTNAKRRRRDRWMEDR